MAKPKTNLQKSMETMKQVPKAKSVERKKSTPVAMPVRTLSPQTKRTMPKSKGPAVLKGEAAAEAMRKRTSPKGVKEFEKGAKKALEKKYPGLYKKTK
jgi:hypothetical protein